MKKQLKNSFPRLKLMAAGVVLVSLGALQIQRGIQVATHWTGQPLFSWGLIAAGAVCFVIGIVPTSLIVRAIDNNRK